MRSTGLLKWLQIVGGVFALVILGIAVRAALAELSAEAPPFRLVPALLAVAGLAAAYLGTIQIWRMLLGELGCRPPFLDTVQLWSFSNLGRYLPGKVWQVIGVVVVARDLGIPGGLAAAAAFINLGIQTCTGALLGLALVPAAMPTMGWAGPILIVIGAGILVPIAWPGVLNEVLRRLPAGLGCSEVPPIGRGALLRVTGAHVVVWLAHGAMFHLFATSFGHVAPGAFPILAGTYALAYVVGLIAVFAPGGIGVREGMIGILLGSVGPAAIPVHLLAMAARLWAIAAELVIFGLALALRFSASRSRS